VHRSTPGIATHRPELASRVVFITGDIATRKPRHAAPPTGAPCVEKPFRVHDFIPCRANLWQGRFMTQDFRIRL